MAIAGRDNAASCGSGVPSRCDAACILLAICLSVGTDYWLYPLTVLIIGSRQRALASLLHEAAHGTLFKTKSLNAWTGRLLCGWPILQSFSAYRSSHVLTHHPKIGEPAEDPDLASMVDAGVYERQTRWEFIARFIIRPLIGGASQGICISYERIGSWDP